MRKFRVNFSVNVKYETIVECNTEEEAQAVVECGNISNELFLCGEEFLQVNDVKEE